MSRSPNRTYTLKFVNGRFATTIVEPDMTLAFEPASLRDALKIIVSHEAMLADTDDSLLITEKIE